ncbi:MAG: aspartyl protease family protein [bacterium]
MKRSSVAWFWKVAAVGMASLVVLLAAPVAGQEISDPYEVLRQYFAASGGLERIKAERTQHIEGSLSVGGMQGPIRIWTEKPDKSRVEAEIGPLRYAEGDNGEIGWVLDTNGKVQKASKMDEVALKRRDVDRRMAELEYVDPGSEIFSVALEGTEVVDSAACYVVSVANSINSDRYIYYMSTAGFRLLKRVALKGDESADTYYGDYREVDGLLVAFYTREIEHQTGQPQETVVTTYESNPDIDAGLFEPPEQSGRDYEFTAGQAAENIPFRFIEGHLFIPVVVNGVERLWILDTGASVTVVDRSFADAIGLKGEGDITGVASGGNVSVSFATLPPFEVKGIRFKEQTVAVIDFGSLIRRLGVDIGGVLGFDFLSRFVTRVDYANEMVSLYDPERFEYDGPGRAVDVHLKESVFEVRAVLDGAHAGTWLFDIGAGLVSLDGRYALREGYAGNRGVVKMGHGAASEYQIKVVRADSLQLAGFTVYEPLVNFNYGGTDSVFTADNLGGLGNSLFRHFIVYVDYSGERVILEKGEKFNQAWPEDKSGLGVGWTAGRDGVEVLYVSPDTPAAAAGFEKGDIIRSVGGVAVEPADGVLRVRELLRGPAGTAYDVMTERAGRETTLTLTLADLY